MKPRIIHRGSTRLTKLAVQLPANPAKAGARQYRHYYVDRYIEGERELTFDIETLIDKWFADPQFRHYVKTGIVKVQYNDPSSRRPTHWLGMSYEEVINEIVTRPATPTPQPYRYRWYDVSLDRGLRCTGISELANDEELVNFVRFLGPVGRSQIREGRKVIERIRGTYDNFLNPWTRYEWNDLIPEIGYAI